MKLYPLKCNLEEINKLYDKINWIGVSNEDNFEQHWYDFLEKHDWYEIKSGEDWNKWFNELPISNKKELYIILIDIIEKKYEKISYCKSRY